MIALCQNREAILAGARTEPVQGALIETLYETYGQFPGLVDFYVTDRGGVLSRQGSELTLSGAGEDAAELCAFARMTGAGRLNALAASVDGNIPGDVSVQRRPVLFFPQKACPKSSWTPSDQPTMDRVFDLVKIGSAPNFDTADRMAFITDIARRRHFGLAQVFTVADAATAGVYATGSTHALIACVATLPDKRGRGYASAAVRACIQHCLDIGRIPALVAEDEDVVDFYARLGFEHYGENLTFILG